jgi:hypothetical protein
VCSPDETCASCQKDCGLCSVCGNGKCEAPYETCSDCPKDCGACTMPPTTCIETATCIFGCFNNPGMAGSCTAGCVSQGCANAQFFVDQVLNCAFSNITKCVGGGGIGQCLMTQCQTEIAACIGSSCQ